MRAGSVVYDCGDSSACSVAQEEGGFGVEFFQGGHVDGVGVTLVLMVSCRHGM